MTSRAGGGVVARGSERVPPSALPLAALLALPLAALLALPLAALVALPPAAPLALPPARSRALKGRVFGG